jgi:WD40 repeat protein
LPTVGALKTVAGSFEFGAQIAPNFYGTAVGTMQLDGAISLWHFDPIAELRLQPGSGYLGAAGQLAVAPDGQRVIAEVADAVRIIDVGTRGSTQIQLTSLGDSECDSPVPRGFPPLMKLSADGRLLGYRLRRCLIVEDLLQHKELAKYRFRLFPAFEFLPDGRLFLAEYTAEALRLHARVWDWRGDRTVSSTIVAGVGIGPTTSVAVSRDGLWVAIRGDDPAVVSIWDAALTHERTRLPPTDATRDMAFNTDGSRLATSGTDNLVRIWDTRTGQLLLLLTDSAPHSGGIVFTDAGRIIAGRDGGGLTIWESKPPVTTIQRR